MVDTEVPIAGALIDVGLALEYGANYIQLGGGRVRWAVMPMREGGDVPIYISGR